MKDTTPLLEIRDVSIRFEFVEALKSVNLTIGHQEVVALVGDNGAGKSTLVKIIAGLYQPSPEACASAARKRESATSATPTP